MTGVAWSSGLSLSMKMVAVCALFLSTTTQIGCDNKEEVLDVETPTSEMEVTRDKDTGETEVEIEREGVE